ncbi:hypothetical protein GYMLUDRAFT_222048 [Collybiopsis luxurians FD-317 M1]|uniref:Protein N-terminal and lysine N-methyltransferase EFM7 n=1 Tax=Collybiopsis luxurians FD-317 M1 TaxID=944289 RepID=A0A0D0CVL2_9AGAR|nr:hypothetical protein GYMLUDRAFT_222048 [Collybiopsis luxurians FD-317 M1]
MSDAIDLGLDSIFTEAPRPPSPEATFSTYKGADKEFKIRLVGSHPLWGHHLWNSALSVASYLEKHSHFYQNKNVLELGAGGALPSLVAAASGARKVVITDYPDPDLIQNIEYNVKVNVAETEKEQVAVQGYIWGHSVEPLLALLNAPPSSASEENKFDLIILSDLIFNHSQHDSLLKTCNLALRTSSSAVGVKPCVWVFYTHHRPHLAHRDMEFFVKAKAQGWDSTHCIILTQKFAPMFPEDPGEEEVRASVHGWILTRNT